MQAYHVPDSSGLIKLDAMENPYTIPTELKSAWLSFLQDVEINRYPDPECSGLKQGLRSVMSIPDCQEIMLGNGSDEIIQMIMMAVAAPGRKILAPEPGFVMYRVIAQTLGLEYVGVPLNEDFNLDTEAMCAAIEQHEPAIIFLASPNNPTGNLFDETTMQQIIQIAPGLVVIDEAYFIFTDKSAMSLLEQYEHLLLMRTVSKLGLAGIRLGFLVGQKEWINEINKIRLPYNINVLTQLSAEFYLNHYEQLQQQAEKIIEGRQQLFAELNRMETIKVFPSQANFLLFRCSSDANDVHASLREQGILIKNLHGSHPMLNNCCRVTVGTAEENQSFLRALRHTFSSY